MGGRLADQEPTLAASDFEGYRITVAEDLGKVVGRLLGRQKQMSKVVDQIERHAGADDANAKPAGHGVKPEDRLRSRGGLSWIVTAPVRWLHQLYVWVMSWGNRPGGTIALAGISVAEASFFPIPPDPLMWALCIGNQKRSLWFATVTTVSSVVGGVIGWLLGAYFFEAIVDWFVQLIGASEAWYGPTTLTPADGDAFRAAVIKGDGMFALAHKYFDELGFITMLIASVTPLPFKVATISAGYFELSLGTVILGSVIGRGARFYALNGTSPGSARFWCCSGLAGLWRSSTYSRSD